MIGGDSAQALCGQNSVHFRRHCATGDFLVNSQRRRRGSIKADGGVEAFSKPLKLHFGCTDERRDSASAIKKKKKMLFPAKLLGIYCCGGACKSVGTAPLSPIISHFHSHQNTLIINETLPHTSWIRPLSECLI